ncbi:hypothetical protein ABW365_06815 [Enterococcus avium]
MKLRKSITLPTGKIVDPVWNKKYYGWNHFNSEYDPIIIRK